MKKVFGILGSIAVVVVILVAMAFGKFAGRAAVDQYASREQALDLTKALAGANHGLPMMVDTHTRLDRISTGSNRVVLYDYTLVNYPLPGQNPFDIYDTVESVQPQVIKETCGNAASRKILDANYTITYRYHDKDGQKLFDTIIKRAHCDTYRRGFI